MNILAISLGSYGDISPFISLGKELQKRGHKFTIGTFTDFKELIIDNNLNFQEISGNSDELVSLLLSNSDNSRQSGINGIEFLLNKYPDLFNDFYSACINKDIIIYNQFGALAYHFAERLNIPVFRSFVFPFDPTKQYSSLITTNKRDSIINYFSYYLCYYFFNKASLNIAKIWRKKLGLSSWNIFKNYRKMNGKKIPTLYQYDNILASRDKNWDDSITLTGNWTDENKAESRFNYINKDLLYFLDSNDFIAYVGFGSMKYSSINKIYLNVVKALIKKDVKIIMPKNAKKIFDSTVNLKDIFFVDFIPFDLYFSKISFAIHHGGCGTVHKCLKYSIPQLVLSFGADQNFWGNQIYYLKIGPKPLDIKKSDSLNLIYSRVDELIKNDMYRINSVKYSKNITNNGVSVAADKLEEYFRGLNNNV